MKKRTLEIMDTTLRDGEQTSGVSFSASEKLTLAKLLLKKLKVDRIEVASARVSDGEFKAVKEITSWAKENKFIEKIFWVKKGKIKKEKRKKGKKKKGKKSGMIRCV